MFHSKQPLLWTVSGLVLLIASFAGFYIGQHFFSNKIMGETVFHGTQLSNPREVSAFSLVGVDEKPFTNTSIRGQWTMMFFGFTHCGYLCPTTMAELAKAYQQLEQKHASVLPTVVMITLDPKRDSLQRLGQYVKAFNAHFYGARTEPKAIARMTQEMGVAYATVMRQQADGSKQTDIEHTGAIMLFNPKGELVAFFTPPHHAKDIANDFLSLIN